MMLVALLIVFDVIAVVCLGYVLWSLLGPTPVVESLEPSSLDVDPTPSVHPDVSTLDDELDLHTPWERVSVSA
jgi:hypothetical protein